MNVAVTGLYRSKETQGISQCFFFADEAPTRRLVLLAVPLRLQLRKQTPLRRFEKEVLASDSQSFLLANGRTFCMGRGSTSLLEVVDHINKPLATRHLVIQVTNFLANAIVGLMTTADSIHEGL